MAKNKVLESDVISDKTEALIEQYICHTNIKKKVIALRQQVLKNLLSKGETAAIKNSHIETCLKPYLEFVIDLCKRKKELKDFEQILDKASDEFIHKHVMTESDKILDHYNGKYIDKKIMTLKMKTLVSFYS
jgi:hypothetical protein